VRTIRGEIGSGQWGAIHAADLTPNNRFVVVGGQLASDDDVGAVGTVRVHEFSDGQVRAELSGLRNVVTALTVSPKNTYAAGGDILGDVCVWRLSPPAPSSSLVQCTQLHHERITGLAFSSDEKKLAASSWDKTLSLSSLPALQVSAVMRDHTDKVISVAFAKDGIISSSYDGTIRLWDSSGRQQKIILGGQTRLVGNLAVAPEAGRALFCSRGSFDECETLSLKAGNFGNPVSRFGKPNRITATAISHDGTLAATAGGSNNEIYVWRTDSGTLVQRLAGVGAEITTVGFAKNGESIAFATLQTSATDTSLLQQKITFKTQMPLTESTVSLRNIVEQQDDYLRELHHFQGAELRLPNDELLEVIRNGVVQASIRRQPGKGSFHSAYTFTPDGKFIVSGGAGGFLALYDLQGNEIRRFSGHTGDITSLAVSADGKTLVSGSSDQLIKVWNLDKETGNLLGTVFVGSDEEWVSWLPEGYYVSSISGDKYAGWQINNGLKAAQYAPFSTYSKIYYDPSRVAQKLARHVVPPPVLIPVPPSVEIEQAVIQAGKLRIRARATSQRNEIQDIRVIVGSSQVPIISAGNPLNRTAEAVIAEEDFRDRVQQNTISIEADAKTEFATGTSSKIVLKYTPPQPPTPEPPRQPPKPRLFVLSIGVSKYENSAFNLEHPADDAHRIVDFFSKQRGTGLFQEVITEELLNEKASRNAILEKLKWLSETPRQDDVRILFLSGHGVIDAGEYFFAAHGYNPREATEVANLSWNDILRRITDAPGKTLLIVDTCHAGAILSGKVKGLIADQNLTDMLNKFARNTRSFVSIASSTRQETVSDDSVFFKALIKGLSGEAAPDRKVVDVADLGSYLVEQVSKGTNNTQHVILKGLEDGGWPLAILR
jgi:WD40 repeat protein